MDSVETKRTVPIPSVGADGEQPIPQTTALSITEEGTKNNPCPFGISSEQEHLHLPYGKIFVSILLCNKKAHCKIRQPKCVFPLPQEVYDDAVFLCGTDDKEV